MLGLLLVYEGDRKRFSRGFKTGGPSDTFEEFGVGIEPLTDTVGLVDERV